jgi:hypothetical protein
MDIRDFSAWSKEAARRALLRRSEMYGASLLPHQKEDSMRRSIDELNMQMYELDHEDAIARVEVLAKRRLEQMKERRRGAK